MNYKGKNRRGRIKIVPNAHPCVRRFIEELNNQKTTFAEVASRTNVGIDTMRFWQSRHVPRVDLLDAALNAIGYELAVRPKREQV